ncbi:MAG: hypothetical protein JSW00_00745 [Thermoplasmata archaeon]|nr:MAG: hypothetical protein JSW00_00745 [Thermoplasmata archaeon]
MKVKIQIVLVVILLQIIVMTNAGCFDSESKPAVLGDYAKHYLQDSKYPKLLIEIDYVQGNSPSNQAINILEDKINKHCDKQQILIDKDSFSSSKSTYSDEDIRELEDEHRDNFNGNEIIVAYILYVNGRYSENEDVLGIAYGPSSIVIFIEQINGINIPWWATTFIDHTDYEKSVLVHEFGHLLAMVNIGYQSERAHESASPYENHCIHEDCVMYHSIETVSIVNLISRDDPIPPYDFYHDCEDDLKKLKSGDY